MTGCAPNIFLYARLVRPCQLLHAGAAWPGLIGCLAAFGYLGWRPAWTPHHPRAGLGPGPRQLRALTGGFRSAETGHGHGGSGRPGRGNIRRRRRQAGSRLT